jgi:hypothetical protein
VSARPAWAGWVAIVGGMIAAHAALGQQANGAGRTAPPAQTGAPPVERGKGAAADSADIHLHQPPGHRTDPRLLKELAPKPPMSHPTSPVPRAPPEPITGPPRNAIGVPIGSTPAVPSIVARPSPPSGVNATGPVPSRSPMGGPAAPSTLPVLRPVVPAPAVPVPPRTTGLNGTTITRPGSGPAMIGGGRTTTGINGTSIRPKHGN